MQKLVNFKPLPSGGASVNEPGPLSDFVEQNQLLHSAEVDCGVTERETFIVLFF